MKLSALLGRVGFPLHGIHPAQWNGPSFVGDVQSRPEGISLVQIVYLDALDASTMGAVVSNVDPSVPSEDDPIARHLVGFVSRFEAGYLVKRLKPRRRFRPFARGEFSVRDMTLPIGGHTVGAQVLTHRELPLQLARTALRVNDRVVDLAVGAWRLNVRDLAPKVDPIDVRFAEAFDAAGASAYPIDP